MPMSDKKKEPRFHGEVSEKSHKKKHESHP